MYCVTYLTWEGAAEGQRPLPSGIDEAGAAAYVAREFPISATYRKVWMHEVGGAGRTFGFHLCREAQRWVPAGVPECWRKCWSCEDQHETFMAAEEEACSRGL